MAEYSGGGNYYVWKEAFDESDDALVNPTEGRFNLSDLVFIPPPDVAGTLSVGLSIKTIQGDEFQTDDEAETASFILDISAVADAPILRPGSDLLANMGDYLEADDESALNDAVTAAGDGGAVDFSSISGAIKFSVKRIRALTFRIF